MARRRGLFARIVDALLGPRGEGDAPLFGDAAPPRPPRPPAPPASAFEPPEPQPPFERVPPEESGIPGSDYATSEELFDDFVSDFGISDDEFATNLLYAGWFDSSISSDQRVEAREMFFSYLDVESGEFDWDAWKDWYENTAAV